MDNKRKKSTMYIVRAMYYAFLAFLFGFVSVPYTAITKEEQKKRCKQFVFIFDMGGVLAKTSTLTMASHIGYVPILKRILWHFQSFSSIKEVLYNLLDNSFVFFDRETKSIPEAYDPQGMLLPYYMRLWLSGKIENSTIKREANSWIVLNASFFSNKTEQIIMLALINAIFTPEIFMEAQYITDEAMQLIRMLKSAKYRLFILSNWDKESFQLLQERHADFFSLFEGIIVSGFEGYMKPDAKIYKILLDRYQLKPSECIFIDDQFENIRAATAQNIFGLLCHDFSAISHVLTSYFIT